MNAEVLGKLESLLLRWIFSHPVWGINALSLAPIADFSGTPTNGTVPLTVAFTDLSTNIPTSWNWSFGDGNTSTLQNPSNVYSTPGLYTVSLNATNNKGSNSTTKLNYINVTAAPNATVSKFSVTPTNGTAPLMVEFTDLSLNAPTSWTWTFTRYGTDPSTEIFSTVQNPVVNFESGRYSIRLNTTNPSGYYNLSSQVTFVNVTSQWTSSNGCWTATDGTYDIMMWNATGASTWAVPNGVSSVEYLIVAGGGSGGRRNAGNGGAGGGGAGGMLNATNYPVISGSSISITVGEGGAGQTITAADGNNGQNSSFDGIEAVGGGGGAAVGNGGKNGGSGGGGDYL